MRTSGLEELSLVAWESGKPGPFSLLVTKLSLKKPMMSMKRGGWVAFVSFNEDESPFKFCLKYPPLFINISTVTEERRLYEAWKSHIDVFIVLVLMHRGCLFDERFQQSSGSGSR